jgi:hypothetical protein
MLLEPSTEQDLQQIAEWQVADQWRVGIVESPEWWLTGEPAFLVCKVRDAQGILAYVRVQEEENAYRIFTLFAPEKEVRLRQARGIIQFIQVICGLAKANDKIVRTQSDNPDLLGFLTRLGFKESSTNGKEVTTE